MRSPLPTGNIYVLKNKRELKEARQVANILNGANDEDVDETNPSTAAVATVYGERKTISVKVKHGKSLTTGKRCRRRRKVIEKIHHKDIGVSIWKRHRITDLNTIASRSFNRDIGAAINIRTLCKWFDIYIYEN